MKKILFLILLFVIKLNAYEFLIYKNDTNNWITFYSNNEGTYLVNVHNGVTTKSSFDSGVAWTDIGNIVYRSSSTSGNWHASGYITKKGWQNQINEDSENLLFLNDFYTLSPQIALNFYHNTERFSSTNHVIYSNYQILYTENGLAVESIVNGVWAGLYSESEKYSSGSLYDSGGTLIYYNGEKVSWIQSAIDKIIHHVIDNLYTLVHIISNPVGVCVSVVFALCLVYYVVEVGRRAIKPIDDNIRKRNLNE